MARKKKRKAAPAQPAPAVPATNHQQELPSSELKPRGTGTIYVHVTDDRPKRTPKQPAPKAAAAEEEDVDDFTKLLEPLSKEELVSLLRAAAEASPATMARVRRAAEFDPATRKLFVHGLGWDAGVDDLRAAFSRFGELEDCRVTKDKKSGKSKGYGFVLFRSRSGALRALRRPQLQIGGRLAYCHLAANGPPPRSSQSQNPSSNAHASTSAISGTTNNAPASSSSSSQPDHTQRKIFIGNVHADVDVDRLYEYFSQFGEIEEGPLMGFDKTTGKPSGFGLFLFVYKSAESASRALEEPMQNFDGRVLNVQATDGITESTPGSNSNANSSATAASVTERSISSPYDPSTDDASAVHDMGFAQQAAMLGMGAQRQAFAQPNFAMLAMMAAAMQNSAMLAAINPAFAAMGAWGQHTAVPGSGAQGFGTQAFAAGGVDFPTAAGLQGVPASQGCPPGFQGTPGFPTSAGFQVDQAASQTGTTAAAAGATDYQAEVAGQGQLHSSQTGFQGDIDFLTVSGLQGVAAYQGGPPGFQGTHGFPTSAGFQVGQVASQTGTTASAAGATSYQAGAAGEGQLPSSQIGFQGVVDFPTAAGLQGVAAYQGDPPGFQGTPGFPTSAVFQVGQAASQTGATTSAAGVTGYQAGAAGQDQLPSSQTGY